MSRRLPRAVSWMIGLVVPAARVTQVVDELEDDYLKVLESRSCVGAHLWLLRETASLLVAYLTAALRRLRSLGPIALRDVRLVLRGIMRGPLAALGAAAMLSTGLLAVLFAAGLAETLLFRQVSAVHGDSL